eukprot:7061234-Pyramimonas_sp.AAC.1
MADQGKASVSVVWFKTTDLRTHDHEPLSAAHSAGFPVLHLFVLDPRLGPQHEGEITRSDRG